MLTHGKQYAISVIISKWQYRNRATCERWKSLSVLKEYKQMVLANN